MPSGDYPDGGDSPTWTTTNGSRTANITGIDGNLDAAVSESGTVTLELTDLQGDVLAAVNPTGGTAPSATYAYTEFGSFESGSGTPGTYGYLGAGRG